MLRGGVGGCPLPICKYPFFRKSYRVRCKNINRPKLDNFCTSSRYSRLVRILRVVKPPETEKGRGSRDRPGRIWGRKWTLSPLWDQFWCLKFGMPTPRLQVDGIQRPVFTRPHECESWAPSQSARPQSGCKLGNCRAFLVDLRRWGRGPSLRPGSPMASAAAGHMEAASQL